MPRLQVLMHIVMTEVMTFSCQGLYARISRLSVRARSGLRKQPTLQSHFYFTSQLLLTIVQQRGVFIHTLTRVHQHVYNMHTMIHKIT